MISALELLRPSGAFASTSEAMRIDGHLAGLHQALAMFLGESPAVKSTARQSRVPDPTKSESWAFVLRALEKAAPSGISADEIHEQAALSGHVMARNTLSANLSNAFKEGVVQRVSRGRYRKHANANGHQPTEIDSSARTIKASLSRHKAWRYRIREKNSQLSSPTFHHSE